MEDGAPQKRKKLKKASRERIYRRRKQAWFKKLASETIADDEQQEQKRPRQDDQNAAECSNRRVDRYANPDAAAWAQTVPASRLDLMVTIKQLAMERMSSLGDDSLAGIFTWKTLNCLGVILEEFMKDRLATSCPSLLPRAENIEEIPSKEKTEH